MYKKRLRTPNIDDPKWLYAYTMLCSKVVDTHVEAGEAEKKNSKKKLS